MKNDLKKIESRIKPGLRRVKQYTAIIYILLFFTLYSFLVLRIGALTAREPTDAEVSEQLKTVRRPKIDEEAAEKIQQLEEQNIDIKSLFNEARRNPFSE